MRNFNDLKKSLWEANSESDRLYIIIKDLNIYNSFSVARDETLPIFSGVITSVGSNVTIGDIESSRGDPLKFNPYEPEGTPFTLTCLASFIAGFHSINDRVVFAVQVGSLATPYDLLTITNIATFQSLGLHSDDRPNIILDRIRNDIRFHRYFGGTPEAVSRPQVVISDMTTSFSEISFSSLNKNSISDISSCLKYNYSDRLIISFLMALGTNQIITLFGAPGTGKTTFACEMARALGAEYSIISVQNNWTDTSDLLGYYNPMQKTYESTLFLEALLDAHKDWAQNEGHSKLHIICLDEMNLARIEYYFATFLSIMQLDSKMQWIRLLPRQIQKEINPCVGSDLSLSSNMKKLHQLAEYKDFLLPPNVRFVGTMNNDDTTNFLSPKVVDRSFFIELTSEDHSSEKESKNPESYYSCSCFLPSITSLPEGETYFKNQNSRFKKYAAQMASVYTSLVPGDVTDSNYYIPFYEDLIIGKVLPSLRYASAYQFDRVLFPRASELFEKHKPARGDMYNYLGSF